MEVLKLLDLDMMEIVGIRDKSNVGVKSIPVLSIMEIKERQIDYIFISSFRYRYEMREDIENEKLNIPIFDLYQHGIDYEFFS